MPAARATAAKASRSLAGKSPQPTQPLPVSSAAPAWLVCMEAAAHPQQPAPPRLPSSGELAATVPGSGALFPPVRWAVVAAAGGAPDKGDGGGCLGAKVVGDCGEVLLPQRRDLTESLRRMQVSPSPPGERTMERRGSTSPEACEGERSELRHSSTSIALTTRAVRPFKNCSRESSSRLSGESCV
eukprot:scaffold5145_cov99-Isochrysis_galbana.AAC.3